LAARGASATALPNRAAQYGRQHFLHRALHGKAGELGYLEGKNVVIERKFAEGNRERLKEFATDLVRQHVDVIVMIGTPAAFAANQPPAQS
jgi:putative ABC transport system substrate-binding protein